MHKKYYMLIYIGFLSDIDETFRIYFDKNCRLYTAALNKKNPPFSVKKDGFALFLKKVRYLDGLLPHIAGSGPWLYRR